MNYTQNLSGDTKVKTEYRGSTLREYHYDPILQLAVIVDVFPQVDKDGDVSFDEFQVVEVSDKVSTLQTFNHITQ